MNDILLIQYVDPGTGSLLAQLLFSFVIGIGFYLLTIRRRLKAWFIRRRSEPDPETNQEQEQPR